jgi:osmotically-inducible protein OsmY
MIELVGRGVSRVSLEYNRTDFDSRLSFKIKVAFKGVKELEDCLRTIKVGTLDGVVHLMGTVPTEGAKMAAEKAANEVGEAKDVIDELVVVH